MSYEKLLCFQKSESELAELNALCAENIKMMILDEQTKIPNRLPPPAIREMCNDIYYWQRSNLKRKMRFNITYLDADKRFSFPDLLGMIDVSTVNVLLGHAILSGDSDVPLLRLGNIIADGLLREYEVRYRVPKNVYWEELFSSNSLLLDYIPEPVIQEVFERDVEGGAIHTMQYPQIGYLRLVHNAMAWISLYDEAQVNDLIYRVSDLNKELMSNLRSQLDSLLAGLWEPIDSLRVYIQCRNHFYPEPNKRILTNW